MCCANLIVTNHEAQHFPSCNISKNSSDTSGLEKSDISQLLFDRVLCDVPCSGDGTLRKAPDIGRKWSAGMGNGVHILQVQIAMRGIDLLKVGGRMVYSTCSMNPVENEAVVSEIMRRCGGSVELLDVSTKLPRLVRCPGIKSWKVFDKGSWLASYKDALEDRRTAIVPSMFPSGQSFDDETAVPSSLDENAVSLSNDIEMENGTNLEDPDHAIEQSEIVVSTSDALEMEVSDLPLDRCMRIVPHDQNTGGFFIAILQKVSPLPAVSSTKLKESSTNGNHKLPLKLSDEILVDTNSSGVITSLDEAKQQPPLLSNVTSGAESSDKQTEVGASGLDSHGVVEENEKEHTQNVNGESDTKRAGGNKRLQNQGKWRSVDPAVFFREDTVLSGIKDFYGISDSFPMNDHLVTRSTDFQSCERIYYISNSVQDVMKLNIQVGQQLKILSIGLKAFERSTVKEDSASECVYRISSEGLPLLLPYISKQVLFASLADFKHLLQYRSIKLADFVVPQSVNKASSQIKLGCCIVVLQTEDRPTSKPRDASTIAIGCWRGNTSLSVMVAETDCQELLERLSARLGFLHWKNRQLEGDSGSTHGTTIITNKHESSRSLCMASDSKETCTKYYKSGKMVVDSEEVDKTEILWDRVLVGAAGDSAWIKHIIKELRKRKAEEGWTASDCALYVHKLMRKNKLLKAEFLFASYVTRPELYFASRSKKREIKDGFVCIGSGAEYADAYLQSELGYQNSDDSFADNVLGLLSAMECATALDVYTGDRFKVHYIGWPNDIHLVRNVHESDVERETNEDIEIDRLERLLEADA